MNDVLLGRIAELTVQRDKLQSRLWKTQQGRAKWRARALAAEFTPSRPDVARELDFLRRENARLRTRVDALGSEVRVAA